MNKANGVDYEHWRMLASWGVVGSNDADWYKARRLPFPQDIKDKRTAHMKKLHTEGAPYAWIGKLYRLNRSQVYRIINSLPNN